MARSETRPSVAVPLPATSLIICSRNRPQLLRETIDSVLGGDEVPSELLVVDQSDAPDPRLAALATARPCVVRYRRTRTVGLSRALNEGIAAARHELLAFTHDDVLVDPGWFGALVRALLGAGERAAVTGRVLAGEDRPGGFQLTLKADPAPAAYRGRVGRDVLYPLNMAMYRAAVAAVGGFDPQLGPGTPFPAAEDNDFGFRLLEAGFRVVYAPEALLYHRAWRPASTLLPLRWAYGRGQGAFYAKHLSLRDRYILGRLRRDLARHARQGARRLRRGSFRLAGGDAAYALGLLSAVAQWPLAGRGGR